MHQEALKTWTFFCLNLLVLLCLPKKPLGEKAHTHPCFFLREVCFYSFVPKTTSRAVFTKVSLFRNLCLENFGCLGARRGARKVDHGMFYCKSIFFLHNENTHGKFPIQYPSRVLWLLRRFFFFKCISWIRTGSPCNDSRPSTKLLEKSFPFASLDAVFFWGGYVLRSFLVSWKGCNHVGALKLSSLASWVHPGPLKNPMLLWGKRRWNFEVKAEVGNSG